jgi:hypothetical protein
MHPPDSQTDEVGEQNPRFAVPGRLGWVLCLSRHSITLMVRAWSLESGPMMSLVRFLEVFLRVRWTIYCRPQAPVACESENALSITLLNGGSSTIQSISRGLPTSSPMQLLIPDVDTSKFARPCISILNILHVVFPPNGVFSCSFIVLHLDRFVKSLSSSFNFKWFVRSGHLKFAAFHLVFVVFVVISIKLKLSQLSLK